MTPRARILDTLAEYGPMLASDVAELAEVSRKIAAVLMADLAAEGRISRVSEHSLFWRIV